GCAHRSFIVIPLVPRPTLFPYTTLFRSDTARCSPPCAWSRPSSSARALTERSPVASIAANDALPVPAAAPAAGEGLRSRRLVLSHFWLAFAAFLIACVLGACQMWARSPHDAPAHTASNYFLSVTLHGGAMAYVLSTFFIICFGYFVAETAL